MNILLGFFNIIVVFSIVVLVEKFFKKEGLLVYVSISTIIANILVCKSIELIEHVTCMGSIMFASNFLATDILCEKYSKKDGRRAVILAAVSQLIFIVVIQFALLYTPSSIDMMNDNMKELFSLNLRIGISSLTMFVASNLFDIYIYERIKKRFPNKLWLRNNVSTIISNCAENYLFTFFAFVGVYDLITIISIASVGSVVEIVIALLDTPFLYLSTKLQSFNIIHNKKLIKMLAKG
ncbi:MAG: queuosine precursor transporter [Clostridia bacterium]|nr:queuosine precursor transporter [Clostridia bacterium]